MNRISLFALGLLAVLATLCGALTARAQQPAAPKPPPCSAPEHRQFDFWLGTWNVMAGDQQAGTNTIASILGGCVLLEHYTTPKGYEGWSHNLYDAARGKWHQTWVDNQGALLLLDGGLVDDAMVLEGDTPARGGSGMVRNRITWTRLDQGRVRQHWQTSADSGRTWANAFDGTYIPAGQ